MTTGLTIIPGQRVEHVVLEWQGYVLSVESGNPRMVNVKTMDGSRERVHEAALRKLANPQANPNYLRKGLVA